MLFLPHQLETGEEFAEPGREDAKREEELLSAENTTVFVKREDSLGLGLTPNLSLSGDLLVLSGESDALTRRDHSFPVEDGGEDALLRTTVGDGLD